MQSGSVCFASAMQSLIPDPEHISIIMKHASAMHSYYAVTMQQQNTGKTCRDHFIDGLLMPCTNIDSCIK